MWTNLCTLVAGDAIPGPRDDRTLWSSCLQAWSDSIWLLIRRFFCPLEDGHHLVTRLWTRKRIVSGTRWCWDKEKIYFWVLAIGFTIYVQLTLQTHEKCKLAAPGTTTQRYLWVWLFTGENEENRVLQTGCLLFSEYAHLRVYELGVIATICITISKLKQGLRNK